MVQDAHEFKWESTGDGRSLDLRITETRDGTFRAENLKDQSQSYECDSREEMQQFLSRIEPQQS